MPTITPSQYWKSIKIWIKNSHVVNRRLSGVINLANYKIPYTPNVFDEIYKNSIDLKYATIDRDNENNIFASVIDIARDDNVNLHENEFEDDLDVTFDDETPFIYAVAQKLLSRSSKYKETFRIILLDVKNCKSAFVNVSEDNSKIPLSPEFAYFLNYTSDEIVLECPSVPESDPSVKWLKERLIPRIDKWTVIEDSKDNFIPNGSLNLVSLNEYNILYQELKIKYGQNLVKIWPEATDPSKFVYEDVAIATYLLLLWKSERVNIGTDEKQTFIDLGCGNGLLVYILTSEGHPGKGLDIRKRGIWDMYPPNIKLEIETVTPSDQCLYLETDWIIGNHSDELTPWIPVMAARSSYSCRFFLLPCCAFEFNGTKYQRQNSSRSQYNEYLEYVMTICNKCGIQTDIDRLKIPSTKRVCLIGTNRMYPKVDHETRLLELKQFIREKSDDKKVDSMLWVSDFKPRDPVEKVKNCTKIDKSIVDEIILYISESLLKEKKYINGWNSGGRIALGDAVKLISPDRLKSLKNECGGLQTLLKNNHHIFDVSLGFVKFRFPRKKIELLTHLTAKKRKMTKKSGDYKPRSCWFYTNHPDGCPLDNEECSYMHS